MGSNPTPSATSLQAVWNQRKALVIKERNPAMKYPVHTLTQPVPMARHTHLLRIGARYYVNVKVPLDLREVLKKELIRKSLKTADYREAVRSVKFESMRIDASFDDARAKLLMSKEPPKSVPSLSTREAHGLVLRWFIELEQRSEQWWEDEGRSLEEDEKEEALYNLRIDEVALSGGSRHYEEDDGSNALDSFLRRQHLALSKESSIYKKLRELFRKALLENKKRTLARIAGERIETTEPLFRDVFSHTKPPIALQTVTLGKMLEQFMAAITEVKKLSAGTIRTYKIPVRILRESFGANTSLESLTRERTEQLFKLLQKAPANATKRYRGLSLAEAIAEADKRGDKHRLGEKTLANYINNIASIFNFAVEMQLMSENPAKGKWMRAGFKGLDKRKRKPRFTIDELNKLFRAPLYQGCRDDEMNYNKAGPNKPRRGRFWVPLLSLFQGFRCNEAAQIYTEDVGEQDGIPYIDIREERVDGSKCDKRLKTEQSDRRVPLHPTVLKIGFLKFVDERRRDKTHPRLFPELRMGASGYFSDPFSKWFGRFVDKAISEECKATFHSLRHHFRNALDEARVPVSDVELLGGWNLTERSAESDYLDGPRLVGPRLVRMHEHIKKVKYPGLKLRHLYRR